MPATFSTASHTGLVRRDNEDTALAQPPLFAVADGMGGAQAGEVASGMAVAALKERQPRSAEALADLVREINREIFAAATGDAGRAGMGTTLTAALVADDRIDFVHVGDSRAYRLRDGKLEQLSEDHSLVGEMVRQGELSASDALSHPQRSIITRALGAEDSVAVDSFSAELAPGDLFLLCSDGLYTMVPPAEVAAITGRGDDLATTAAALIEAANGAGGEDNVTVVLFSPDGAAAAGSMDDTAVIDANGASTSSNVSGADGAGRAQPPWWRSWKAIAAAIAVLIVMLGAGSWYMTRQVYYLGVSDGQLSIYQGVPVDVGPLSLSTLYRQSDVAFDSLEPYEQDRVRKQELSSLATAEEMLKNFAGQGQPLPAVGPGASTGRTTGTSATTTGAGT